MEKVTSQEMAALEGNLRKAQLQQVDTLKMVNLLNSLGDEAPLKLDGNQTWELRKMVCSLEDKGVKIPGHKYPTAAEFRTLRSDISKAGLSLKAIIGSTAPAKGKPNTWTDAELDRRIDAQIAEFERSLAERDELAERNRPDPLLAVTHLRPVVKAAKRTPVRHHKPKFKL
jgi:hypothetical protein